MNFMQQLLALLGLGHNAKFERFTRAAETGNSDAMYLLGWMYCRGEGVPQNYAQAADWFRKAADAGNTSAKFSLGGMYYEGKGVPQDYARAADWFRKAADAGDSTAMNILGGMFFLGDDVPEDYVQAHKWFNLAAARGGKEHSTEMRECVAAKMTPEQIAEAQRLAREWKPAGGEE